MYRFLADEARLRAGRIVGHQIARACERRLIDGANLIVDITGTLISAATRCNQGGVLIHARR